jgi:hypothetical protein
MAKVKVFTPANRPREGGHPVYVGCRLSLTERAILAKLAEREQTSLSAMIRECILRESVRPLFGGEVRDAPE